LGKGRYLKAAERACARKARFETHAAAEAFVAGRYRAYRCVVCGGYHLTSGRGDREEAPSSPPKEPPGPRLGDLDWSAVLDPKPKPENVKPVFPSARQEAPRQTARCAEPPGKDGKVLLVVEGRLVKSARVDRALRPSLAKGIEVEIEGEPPKVVRLT